MADVLRLNCSIESEKLACMMVEFTDLVTRMVKLLQNAMEIYVELDKVVADCKKMCLLHRSKCEARKNKYIVKPESITQPLQPKIESLNQVLEQNTETTPLSTLKNLSAAFTPDLDFQCNETLLGDSNSECKINSKDKLLKSPDLIKKRLKTRRSDSTPKRSCWENTSGTSEQTSLDFDTPTSSNSLQDSKFTLSAREEKEGNDDEIENTPVPKKLGVSKLYHVDTTLLQSGKKLKQSKLVLLPIQKGTNVTANKRYTNLESSGANTTLIPKKKSHEPNTPEQPIDEDIIESSPNRAENQLKMKKRLKLKRTSPKMFARKRSAYEISRKSDAEKSQSMALGKPFREITFTNLNQLSSPIHSSTQREETQLIKRSPGVFGLSREQGTERDCVALDFEESPVLVDIENSVLGYTANTTLQEPGKRELASEPRDFGTQKKKKFAESTLGDETFFSLKERDRKEDDYVLCASDLEDEFTIIDEIKPSSPSVKRSLMTSFDIVPPKKEDNYANNSKTGKCKVEKAKLDGRSCWECKQYYQNLGLSEKEIQMRQNQCSRHRTKYKEKPSTPEGFWDPVFSDTQSSTLSTLPYNY